MIAVPTRTHVDPCATASSRSPVIPADNSSRPDGPEQQAWPRCGKVGERASAASEPSGGTAINPASVNPCRVLDQSCQLARASRSTPPRWHVSVETDLEEHVELDCYRRSALDCSAPPPSRAHSRAGCCRRNELIAPTRRRISLCFAASVRSCASERRLRTIAATFADASCSRDSPNSRHPISCRMATSLTGKNFVTGNSATSAGDRPPRHRRRPDAHEPRGSGEFGQFD